MAAAMEWLANNEGSGGYVDAASTNLGVNDRRGDEGIWFGPLALIGFEEVIRGALRKQAGTDRSHQVT